MGRDLDKTQYVSETMDLDLFFKSMRIRILFIGQKNYARIKLRTMLKAYGYKRRSDRLLAYIDRCMMFFHLVPYLHGEPCKVAEVSVDDMITFRIP